LTTLITVGGFLGAGKTTLIARAASILAGRGRRAGVLTNDQAADLVDTAVVKLAGFPVGEVAGSCFCCAFGRFEEELENLSAVAALDVVLAEPVGSCVDIAATVLRPLEQRAPGRFRVAPFTVVLDPAAWRLAREARGIPEATAYIYHMQLREADVIALNKSDAETPESLALAEAELAAYFPHATVVRMSASAGAGVEEWLDGVLAAASPGGGARIEVDYDTYAEGEANLGWLNANVVLEPTGRVDWGEALDDLMAHTVALLEEAQAPPAHLKCLLTSGDVALAANSVAGRPRPERRELSSGESESWARLIVNARAPLAPVQLRQIVAAALAARPDLGGVICTLRAFAPSRPVPIYRM
jgi:Ni2+-binding GTPase involved in maturation of urease and hydrogenase